MVVHALVIMSPSMAIGGSLFLMFLAQPFASRLTVPIAAYGAVQAFDGAELARRTALLTAWSALALIVAQGLTVAMRGAVLKEAVGLDLSEIVGAKFVVAGLIKMAAALLLALLLFSGNTGPRRGGSNCVRMGVWRGSPLGFAGGLAADQHHPAALSRDLRGSS